MLGCTRNGGHFLHRVLVDQGTLRVGASLELAIDLQRRGAIRRNHTATHLLHAALRRVLGEHVNQQGSVVGPERLRFDFWHFDPLTPEQLRAVEDDANAAVLQALPCTVEQMSYDEAVKSGAMALFGEKYGDEVRVVRVPGVSTELCGGTHCHNTGEIGLIKVVSESGVAANVRRIVAVTGHGVLEYLRELEVVRQQVSEALRGGGGDLVGKIEKMMEERKRLERELDKTRTQMMAAVAPDPGSFVHSFDGFTAHIEEVWGGDARLLREHADRTLDRMGSGVVVLGVREDGAARLVVKVSKDLMERVHAGNLVRALAETVGGKGGGRPDMAQAGGKDPGSLPKALEQAASLLAER